MGRAARWLKSILGGGGGKKSSGGVPATAEEEAPPPPAQRERRRWGFVRSMRERDRRPDPAREDRKGSYRETTWPAPAANEEDDEQSKRAIAVAAATAAVAEAAVAAAKAAAAVVRITSSGRVFVSGAGVKLQESAAVKIQASFRGYLARRALRALRGLVKLQALVRGNIVRKQAAETLRCMQALVRVQARARSCRALLDEKLQPSPPSPPPASSRHHLLHPSPPTPEKFENPVTRRHHVPRPDRSAGSLRRSSSRSASTGAGERSVATAASSGWNWLDRWMEERYMDDDRSAKIVEIDTGKPQKQRGARSSCSPATSDQKSRSFATIPDSPSSTVVDMNRCLSPLGVLEDDDGDVGAEFQSATSRPGSSRRCPAVTPGKSECSRSLFGGYSDGNPNYMACTESSRAKSRSQSAPRQRPPAMAAAAEFEKSASGKQQLMAAAAMRVGFANRAYPGSGRLDRLGMPTRF